MVRSETSASPFGRNAMPHGTSRAVATVAGAGAGRSSVGAASVGASSVGVSSEPHPARAIAAVTSEYVIRRMGQSVVAGSRSSWWRIFSRSSEKWTVS